MPSPNSQKNTFNAGSFGKLRYDFTAFGGVTGIIPDPSDQQIEEFIDTQRSFMEEVGLDPDSDEIDNEALGEMLENDEDGKFNIAEMQRKMVEAVAKLCSDSPSTEAMSALPFRVRQAFLLWVQNQFLNPEASAVGTTSAQSRRTGG